MADLDGFDAMLQALEGIAGKVYAGTPDALAQAAHYVEGMVKTELSRTSHPRGTPTPSPPGSPPSLISGALRRSVQVEGPQQTGAGRWSASVGSGLVYAAVQERGGNHLPARPYMLPGVLAALPGIEALMYQSWADALN
jgi:hypothetical protein